MTSSPCFRRTVLRRWQIENHKDSETNLRLFKRELEALQTLKHPNIVQMLGFEDNQNGFAVIHLEYISNLSLNEVIFYATYRYSALTMIYWLQDILNGVGFLHFNGFLHRDLKPSNILVTADGSLKLIDFETAKTNLDPSKTYTFGKDEYRPPESFSLDGSAVQFGKKGDVYAIGIITWEMIRRMQWNHPWTGEHGQISYRERLLRPISRCRKEFLEIVEVCTIHSPMLRVKPSKILKHIHEIRHSRIFDNYQKEPIFDENQLILFPPDGLGIELEKEESLEPPEIVFDPGPSSSRAITEQIMISSLTKDVRGLIEKLDESEKEMDGLKQVHSLVKEKLRQTRQTIDELESCLEGSLKGEEGVMKSGKERKAITVGTVDRSFLYLEEVKNQTQIRVILAHQNESPKVKLRSESRDWEIKDMSLEEEQTFRQPKLYVSARTLSRKAPTVRLPNPPDFYRFPPDDPFIKKIGT